MKKIINRPETIVRDMCHGIVLAHPDLELVTKYHAVKRTQISSDKVTLISGGGSGHEPAHAGFVGKGMLDAAVCGDVFASPSQIQVYQTIKRVASEKGTLLIIKNYSGDIMNFKNAAHLAQEDGITVDYVIVNDDIAVEDSLYTVGRRGVAGTMFVHKLAGAAAERGEDLAEVARIAQKAANQVCSLGFALTSCTVPAKGSPTFELSDDEIEYGVGIHGEPGIRREKLLSAHEMAGRIVGSICHELDIQSGAETRVALLINGFGATPLMELYLLNNEVSKELYKRRIKVARTFVGNYMTSLDMSGASVSLLKLDDELEELLNDPCDTPGLKVTGPSENAFPISDWCSEDDLCEATAKQNTEVPEEYAYIENQVLTLKNIMYMMDVMSKSAIDNEISFCEMDAHAGDGDFGMSIAKGFQQIKCEWNEIISMPNLDIGSFLDACSLVMMEHCGGASGPIWGSAFRMAGKSAIGKHTLDVAEFAQMMLAAIEGVQSTGERSFGRGAVIGDKTLIDALIPCANSLKASAEKEEGIKAALLEGAAAAQNGAEKTKEIVARMGRAGLVGERSLGYPDAGAYALGVIFGDIAQAMQEK